MYVLTCNVSLSFSLSHVFDSFLFLYIHKEMTMAIRIVYKAVKFLLEIFLLAFVFELNNPLKSFGLLHLGLRPLGLLHKGVLVFHR